MSADVIAALCVELASLASGRVWGIELDPVEAALAGSTGVMRDNIVLTPAGRVPSAGDNSYIEIGRVRVDVRCYGADPFEALALYLAAHDAMKGIVPHVVVTDAGDVMLHNATVSAGPFALRDPDTDWPFVMGVYGVSYHEAIVIADVVT